LATLLSTCLIYGSLRRELLGAGVWNTNYRKVLLLKIEITWNHTLHQMEIQNVPLTWIKRQLPRFTGHVSYWSPSKVAQWGSPQPPPGRRGRVQRVSVKGWLEALGRGRPKRITKWAPNGHQTVSENLRFSWKFQLDPVGEIRKIHWWNQHWRRLSGRLSVCSSGSTVVTWGAARASLRNNTSNVKVVTVQSVLIYIILS
jgi:hypothetical protein